MAKPIERGGSLYSTTCYLREEQIEALDELKRLGVPKSEVITLPTGAAIAVYRLNL